MKNTNIKKSCSIIFALLFTLQFTFAQVTLNPSHSFYKSVQSWQNRKLIGTVPVTRPYSASNIKEILQIVLENGSEKDKALAEQYWLELTGKPWNAVLAVDANLKAEGSDIKKLFNVLPSVNGNINLLNDKFNIGYKFGISIRNDANIENYLPEFSNYSCDGRFDPAEFKSLKLFIEANNIFSYRKNGIILQAGIFRQGYGDFLNEGVTMNDTAFHRPTILFSYSSKLFSYTQSLSMLGATVNSLYTSSTKDTKYLAFHSIDFTPFNWLSAAFYETSTFGKRFDFSYMIPAPYMIAQSFSGYADSLMMGVRFKIIPFSSFAIKTDLLVDDLAVNELLKFNLNSKNRIAWNTALEYTPEESFIDRIALNYLIVTPYTYSHWDYNNAVTEEMTADTINYQNYTNCGYTIGTTLPPNSMQLKLNVDFQPLKKLNISLFGSYNLHANIVETLTPEEQMIYALADENIYSTDGSIYTHPYYYDPTCYYKDESHGYIMTAWDYLNYLNQAHKMTVVQAGLNTDYVLFQNNYGSLTLKLSYIFELIKNKGVDSNIYPGQVTYDKVSEEYTYNGHITKNRNEVLNYYKQIWISNFKDVINNFVYIGIEYKY